MARLGTSKRLMTAAMVVLVATLIPAAVGFYIPGVAPHEFKAGDPVEVKAVKLSSVKNPLPYEYYFLPYCRPETIQRRAENLGEVLRGDRITNTPLELRMKEDKACQVITCPKSDLEVGREYKKKQVSVFMKFIMREYRAHWLVDNLPSATKVLYDGEPGYVHGFPVGYIHDEQVFLNNHLQLVIKIHNSYEDQFRIVGFEVQAQSIDRSAYKTEKDGKCSFGTSPKPLVLQRLGDDASQSIIWSYGVRWEASDIAWASRWDTYLYMSDSQIHWFSIINSVVTVMFLSGIFAVIIVRTLSRDIAQYNSQDEEDDDMEPTGWKLVHGDVFRPPDHANFLVVVVGTGVQLFVVAMVTICFACLGMLSPASRGALMTMSIVLFAATGGAAGYHAARLYKTLKGENWKNTAILTALFFPGIVFTTGFILNFFIWGEKSSGAVPFTTMIALLLMWFGVSLPLVMCGFFFGFRKEPYSFPVTINTIPRLITDQKWYMHPVFSCLVAGMLPFGAIFIELFFILSAIWENQFYYLFGFLIIVFLVLFIACAEMTIVMTYMQLCAEDWRWWWRSFCISGSCAIYVFLYSIFYYATKLEIDSWTATMMYFGYSGLMALAIFFLTGSIGFYATFFFIRQIYGAVKID